jgi:serine phosphatase RsbU (regulator of sigma subunit)
MTQEIKMIFVKKYWLVLIILLSACANSFSQNKKVDSVYRRLQVEKIDTSIIKSHIYLCYTFNKLELFDSAYFHGQLANTLSVAKKYDKGYINSLRRIGDLFFDRSEFDSSIYYHKKALLKVNDKTNVVYFDLVNILGNSYFYIGDYINAYDYFSRYLQQAEISGNDKQKAKGNSNVGVILKEQKKYDEALLYFNKTIQIGISINDFKTQFVGYSNKGNIYNEKAKLKNNKYLNQLAIDNYIKAQQVISKIEDGDYRNPIMLYANMGNVYADLNQYDKAIEYFSEAIMLVKENEFFPQAALIYNNLTGIYLDLNDLKMAEKYLKEANDYSIKSQSSDDLAQSYQNYARYYELKGDFANAFKSYKLYKSYNDSTFNTENTERLKELQLKIEFEKKESIKQAEQDKKDAVAQEEKNKQRIVILAISIVLFLVVILAFFIFNGLKKQRLANKIISEQKEEVHKQKSIIEEHQKEMVDSINYAKKIQYALLAQEDLLKKNLSSYFILFNPKDIVSGDFYWAAEHNDKFYLACCDSTGHGVPGAFMSLLNMGFLSEAIKEKNIEHPHEIFNYVRLRLINSISSEEQKDGMDGIIICIDKKSNEITYAAANNEPILISNNQVIELPKDKMPVGKGERMESFKLQSLSLQEGDVLYLYTDGYADQFGGPKGKKFKYKQLNDLLLANSKKSMNDQSNLLVNEFDKWKGNLEQVDDVCVIGIRI